LATVIGAESLNSSTEKSPILVLTRTMVPAKHENGSDIATIRHIQVHLMHFRD